MKKKPLSSPKSSDSDVSILESQALSKQNAGQYKEAIDLYKSLLKHEKNADWRDALAQCYLQRALTFAAKGMVKEALVLWENYAQNAEPPHLALDRYIGWLLQTNNTAKVKTCLAQLSAQQLDEEYPELAALLGLLIITGKVDCLELLPKDGAVMTHLGFVQDALSAYRNNKLEDIEPALKKLPFRSAFRDFRTLMKAALLLPESVEQAQALLAKIPADSPYRQAGALLLAVTHNGATLVNDLLQFTPQQIKIIAAAKNFNKKQLELLDILSKQKDRLSDKLKFNLAIQYQALLGADLAQHYCLAALSTYPAGQRDFTKHFGAINDFEAWRFKALTCERDRDYHDAEYYWKQGIAALKTQGAKGAFKIALIMRHIAIRQETPEEAMTWIMDSLDYDTDDRDSYVKILKYYERQEQETDTYKEWLDKSIKKFPNDVELLSLAIKAATRNKAFRKATQYAQALLKVDPVNTFAKQVLLASHLAHARKLIKSKKFHLVEKELQQAETITIGKRYQTLAQLMRGFFMFVTVDKKQGAQLIAESVQKLNDGLACAYFCVTLEALLLDLQPASLLKSLPPLAKDYVLSAQEITQLIKLIQQYADNDNASQALLHKALEKIKTIIKQSLKQQDYGEELLLSLCQCLDHIQHFELLNICAKIAQRLWLKPIWIYYRIYAEVKGNPEKCSHINSYRLQENIKIALEQKDQRTASLIGKFLEKYYESINPKSTIFDSLFGNTDDNEDYEEDEEPMNELFGHLPDELFDRLDLKVNELMKKNPPERMFKMLAAAYLSNNIAKMQKLFNDTPEILYAFLMLKAADDLGLDIDVTAEEIIECFEDQKPTSFPFF
jgi:hypothetical protein